MINNSLQYLENLDADQKKVLLSGVVESLGSRMLTRSDTV